MPELSALAASLLVVAAAASVGWSVVRLLVRVPIPGLEAAERRALELLAGSGVLGLALFLVGLWRLNAAVVASLLAAALVPAAVVALANRRRLALPAGWWRWVLHWEYAVAALVLLVRLVAALDLPRGDSDDISYHLLGPKVWLETGQVRPVLEHSHTAFPATPEMLYAAGMALSNPRAPGLISVVFGVILLVQVWGIARRLGASERAARLAVVLAATTPALLDRVGTAFIDTQFTGYALGAMRLLLEYPSGGPLALGAALAGFAVGTKYTGLILVAVLGLATLLPIGARIPLGDRMTRALALGLIAALVGCPWYIRNWIELGSPIYPPPPGLARLFPARAMPPEAIAEFQAYITSWGGASFGRSPLDLLLSPFRLTFQTPVYNGFAGGIGLAMLAFAPLGIALRRREPMALRLTTVVVVLFLAWFYTQQEIRFTLHMLAVLSAFAAIAAEACLAQPSRAGRLVALAALAVNTLHGALVSLTISKERLLAVASGRGRQAYEPSRMPDAAAVAWVNTHPEVTRVLPTARHFKLYYLDKPFVVAVGEHGERPLPGVTSVADALGRLRELGISHVIDTDSRNREDPGWKVAPGPGLELVFEAGSARVYRVR